MAIVYPAALDTFNVPSDPADTTLSSAGTSTRDHTQSHQDLGLAIMALQASAAQLSHDHSGGLAGVSIQETTIGGAVQNDTQTVTVIGSPTGGTFELTLSGYGSTAGIAYNAAASAVQSALQAVSGLSGNVVVGGSAGGPYVCVFQASLAATPLSTMTSSSSLTPSGSVNVTHNVVGSPGGDEVQTVSLTGGPTGGTWSLTFNGYTTGNFAYNASAATVQSGLVALTSIGSSHATVSGSNGGPYTVTFTGTLANAPQSLLTYTNNLTGGLFATNQLDQVNTHQNADTDISSISVHHTLGLGQGQAAAGNHAHDYSGPSIYNKPYQVCTSTTRPPDPFPGMTIFETDTGCWRAWWAANSNNVATTGIDFDYDFNTDNDASFLDPSLFSQTYVVGTFPTDGAMGSPQAGECTWKLGANVPARCISQAIGDNSTFDSDEQILEFTIGTITQGAFGSGGKTAPAGAFGTGAKDAPYEVKGVASNDAYLRVSDDGQSYVRFGMINAGVAIAYTTSGPTGETLLGSVNANAPRLGTAERPGTLITCKAIGQTYTLYQDGVPILSVTDYQNLVSVGADYRGWAIGMQAAKGVNAQYVPYSIANVTVMDNPTYSTQLIWQLLNVGAVPHVRAESRYQQEIFTHTTTILFLDLLFFFIVDDWTVANFLDVEVSNTDITIQEAGSYGVHASVCWDPDFNTFDHAAVAVVVNGQDIGRKNWEFVRGNGFAPGFPQTNEIYFTYYFAQGDIVRVQLANNAGGTTYTYYNSSPPNVQTCYAELDFLGPT